MNLADIDECSEGSHQCSHSANCSNTEGGYECHCSAGYTGNGTVCEGILLHVARHPVESTYPSSTQPCLKLVGLKDRGAVRVVLERDS